MYKVEEHKNCEASIYKRKVYLQLKTLIEIGSKELFTSVIPKTSSIILKKNILIIISKPNRQKVFFLISIHGISLIIILFIFSK